MRGGYSRRTHQEQDIVVSRRQFLRGGFSRSAPARRPPWHVVEADFTSRCTRCDDCVLRGDADFESVKGVASAMTPVPGGVGPMTIAQLLVNTVQAYVWGMEARAAGEE